MHKIKQQLGIIKQNLQKNQLDGWLLYSFQGLNKLAEELSGISFATRRWYFYIKADGSLSLLVHEIEKSWFENFQLPLLTYKNNEDLNNRLIELLDAKSSPTIAMEYSPNNEIPYISKVDAGTFEQLKNLGVNIVSSAELIQETLSRWGGEKGIQSHQMAVKTLEKAFNEACQKIRQDINQNGKSDEYQVQQLIMKIINDSQCESYHPVIVATDPNHASPHYFPTPERTSPILEDQLVLFDMWCREKNNPEAIYADITLLAYTGKTIPENLQKFWRAISGARDTTLNFIRLRTSQNIPVQGWEIDQQARQYLANEKLDQYFIHRLGHSIQTEVHARGVNLDSYELKDTRYLIPDIGFSIEPGVYLENQFGVRSEIDVYIDQNGQPQVYSPIQTEITLI